jgi:hypothetical protein
MTSKITASITKSTVCLSIWQFIRHYIHYLNNIFKSEISCQEMLDLLLAQTRHSRTFITNKMVVVRRPHLNCDESASVWCLGQQTLEHFSVIISVLK